MTCYCTRGRTCQSCKEEAMERYHGVPSDHFHDEEGESDD